MKNTKIMENNHELIGEMQDAILEKDNQIRLMAIFIKGALAALSQNKTYPADVVAAKSFLNCALMGY